MVAYGGNDPTLFSQVMWNHHCRMSQFETPYNSQQPSPHVSNNGRQTCCPHVTWQCLPHTSRKEQCRLSTNCSIKPFLTWSLSLLLPRLPVFRSLLGIEELCWWSGLAESHIAESRLFFLPQIPIVDSAMATVCVRDGDYFYLPDNVDFILYLPLDMIQLGRILIRTDPTFLSKTSRLFLCQCIEWSLYIFFHQYFSRVTLPVTVGFAIISRVNFSG